MHLKFRPKQGAAWALGLLLLLGASPGGCDRSLPTASYSFPEPGAPQFPILAHGLTLAQVESDPQKLFALRRGPFVLVIDSYALVQGGLEQPSRAMPGLYAHANELTDPRNSVDQLLATDVPSDPATQALVLKSSKVQILEEGKDTVLCTLGTPVEFTLSLQPSADGKRALTPQVQYNAEAQKCEIH